MEMAMGRIEKKTMKAKYLFTLITFIYFKLGCYSQDICTDNINLNRQNLELDKGLFDFIFNNSSKIDPTIIIVGKKNYNSKYYPSNVKVVIIDESNNSQFLKQVIDDSIHKKNVNYTLIEKGKKYQKLFKDNHYNYFRYKPLNSSINAGKVIETYQKYDSIYIGMHIFYKYELENGKISMKIDRKINYDTIYPICWSSAINIALKNKFKGIKLNLIPPKDYPEKKMNKANAFWKVYNNCKDTLKINAFSGKILK
jgi:hypothetical protein